MRGFVALAEKDLAATLALAREHGVDASRNGARVAVMARVYGLDDDRRRCDVGCRSARARARRRSSR